MRSGRRAAPETPDSGARPPRPPPNRAATCSSASTSRRRAALRRRVPELPLKEKTLVWHLYQAALAGRDIYYDQRYAHNLEMRDVLEAIVTHPAGVDAATLAEIQRYTKLFWINTGPYNNLTARKFVLTCTPAAFAAAAHGGRTAGARLPAQGGRDARPAARPARSRCSSTPTVDPMVTTKTPPPGKDILTASANNLYVGVTMKDLEGFDERYPLNSRLVKQDGTLVEEVYRVGGRYGAQIAAIVGHLEAAIPFATEPMATALRALDQVLPDRRDGRPRGVRHRLGAGQGVAGRHHQRLHRGLPRRARHQGRVGRRSCSTSTARRPRRFRSSPRNAQWFEDHMPWDPKYRKPGVQGITANAIDVVIETGDSGPITPVGINLPNDQAIREQHGSKSVSLSNVNEAYDKSTLPAFRTEFSWTPEEAARATKWGAFAGELTTNMHEVIGHASGKVDERLKGNPQAALKEQFSALEEARADLVALYFLPDPKLVELGLVAAADQRRDRPRRVRGLRAQRARAAAARPRGHADRRRPHAQPPDDRPLADGQHEGDRGARRATARRTT